MKRILTVCMFALLSLALHAGGIGTAKDLEAFIKAYNESADVSAWMDADSVFRITADLDLSKSKKLPQIKAFAGILDGCGHSLSGWKTQCGLISEILPEAVVRGIVIDASCSMKVTSKTEAFAVGFIADTNRGLVSDCENHGAITHKCTYTVNHIYIGGLVGINKYCIMNCRNFGRISTESTGSDASASKEITCAVGGIAGGSPGKLYLGATIAGCVNEGEVDVFSDFFAMDVAGIVGLSGSSTVKFCINRAPVSCNGIANTNSGASGQVRVAGIVALAKADVMCCDNFGAVTATGVGAACTAGIVGMPHAALVVGDCVNFGKVESSTENPCYTGGIAGNCGRPVHFRRCVNRGEIRFSGVSARERSATGGILGQCYLKKEYDMGTYVRNCVNYGKVHSESGGNNYVNSDKSIHTGGIAGFMQTREDVLAYLYECVNKGEVTSVTGRRSNMCASFQNVTTGGSAPDDYALSVQALPDGANVYGRVTATDGSPVEGAVVSDGIQCVRTGVDGSYSMHSDLSKTYFVTLSVPAAYNFSSHMSVPQTFRRVRRGEQAVCANFSLERRAEISSSYTVLMIGDPQVRPLRYGDGSMETWGADVAPDIEAFRASCSGDVYAINLGDLVYNYMYAYDDYLDNASRIHCPVFNVIGNHDYDQQTLFDGHLGQVFYETYIGPENYSFDIGDIHYLVLNSIMYDRKKPTESYGSGLDDRTMTWLENDLSFVPKEKTLVVCAHANLFKKPGDTPNGSHGVYNRNYDNYRRLLAGYAHVYSWSGHYHNNYYYNYAGKKTRHGADNIESICVARCTGALRMNKAIMTDGTPQGYMVARVDGGRMEWSYKSVGHDLDHQMRLYAPGRCGDALARAVIWNYSEGWSTPEWYEDGVKVADMELTRGIDPDYKALYDAFDNERDRKYCKPTDETWIFSVTPSNGAHGGEVRVRDQFGKEYISHIQW